MAFRSSPGIRELAQPGAPDVTFSTASGAHVLSIPNWVVGTTVILYHQLQQMMRVARVRASTNAEVITCSQGVGEAALEQD